jgi:hypothetical protein
MNKAKESILEHFFKATKDEQRKKMLMLDYGLLGPAVFHLLAKPNSLEKTLALGSVINEVLTELAHNGKNLFSALISHQPFNHWSRETDIENAGQRYLVLFDRFRKEQPELFSLLINTPDKHGAIPLTRIFTHYGRLKKEINFNSDRLNENIKSLIEFTDLNNCYGKDDSIVLKNYVDTMNTVFKYKQVPVDFTNEFLNLLIQAGLDLNLPLTNGNTAMLKVLTTMHDKTLSLFLPHFDKINFNITNHEGDNFFDILSTKEENIRSSFEQYYLNQTMLDNDNKKKYKI